MQKLPTNEFEIEYKIHNNFLKYDESKLKSNPSDRKIIRELLKKVEHLANYLLN